MCGIFGFIKSKDAVIDDEYFDTDSNSNWNKNYTNTKEGVLYKTLLVATSLRGIDSTGTTVVEHKDNTTITQKAPVNALQYTTLGEYKLIDHLVDSPDIGVIGHCRAGTIGSASYRASHPFDFESVVGVHNGTLSNHTTLGVKNTISDSEAIFYTLDKSESYTKDIARFSGSYALVWFDKTTGLYYFCRNKERPLWFYKTKDSLVFASELDILQFGLCRAYNKTVEELRVLGEFNQFAPYTLYEYDKSTGEFTEFTIEEPAPVTKYNYGYTTGKHPVKKIENQADKDSPFQEEDSVELIPCGFNEYPNNSSNEKYGSMFGYIYYAGKSYFWISYGIKGVKDFFSNFYDSFPEVKTLYGSVAFHSYQTDRKEAYNMKDVITGVHIHPELNDKDEVLVVSIKAGSLTVTEANSSKNLPAVMH